MGRVIPDWVKEAINKKIAEGDVGAPCVGVCTLYVSKGDECWCARFEVAGDKPWGEDDPTKQPDVPTWENCYIIYQV